MSQFTGLCSYPHGGYVTIGFMFCTCTAMTATMYAIASCRFAVLTFMSNEGNFEESFRPGYIPTFGNGNDDDEYGATNDDIVNITMASIESSSSSYSSSTSTSSYIQYAAAAVASDEMKKYKSSIGLFQWLRPVSNVEWTEGSCVGYQQSMLREFSERTFETSRGFAVLAVVLAIVVTTWSLLSACISWNTCQVALLIFLLLCGTLASSMTFLFLQSEICHLTLHESSCTLDEGGMVLVAGVILWLVALLIVIVFVRPTLGPSRHQQQQMEWRHKHVMDERLRELRATAMRQKELNRHEKEKRIMQKNHSRHDSNAAVLHGTSNNNKNKVLATSTSRSAMRSPNRKTPDPPSRNLSTLPSTSSSSNSKNNTNITYSSKVGKVSKSKNSKTHDNIDPTTLTPKTIGIASSFDSYDSVNSFQNRQRGKQFLQSEYIRQQEQERKQQKHSRSRSVQPKRTTTTTNRSRSVQPKQTTTTTAAAAANCCGVSGLVMHEPTLTEQTHHGYYGQNSPPKILRQARSMPPQQRQQQQHAQQQQQQRHILASSVAAATGPQATAAATTTGMKRSSTTTIPSTSRPIPRTSSTTAASQQQQQQCMTSRQPSSSPPSSLPPPQQKQQQRRAWGLLGPSMTVDDVTSHQELEVYISEKMSHIDNILVGMDNNDSDDDSDDSDDDNSKIRKAESV